MKFYKTSAVHVLLYGSESWILRKQDLNKITAAEMKFLRSVKGCTREDRITNTQIRADLEIFAIEQKIENYKQNWKDHISRMEQTRYPKQIIHYRPEGRRDVGRPRKRWS